MKESLIKAWHKIKRNVSLCEIFYFCSLIRNFFSFLSRSNCGDVRWRKPLAQGSDGSLFRRNGRRGSTSGSESRRRRGCEGARGVVGHCRWASRRNQAGLGRRRWFVERILMQSQSLAWRRQLNWRLLLAQKHWSGGGCSLLASILVVMTRHFFREYYWEA